MVLSDELNIKRLTMYCRKHGLEESEYLQATHKRQARLLLDLYQKNPAYESLRKESFDEFFKLPPCDQVYAHIKNDSLVQKT